MPIRFTHILLLHFILLNQFSLAQDQDFCHVKNTSFIHDEQITYVVSYTWLFVWTDVGEAHFAVTRDTMFDRETLHLRTTGNSYPFYDWFFRVRDVYESWVDPTTLQPLYFNRDINEGGYTKENQYTFDWDKNEVNARIRRRGGQNRFYTIQVKPCIYDVVTAIYVARNLKFESIKVGQSFPVDVILDREIYNVKYTFLARENKKVKGAGPFKTLKFRVELVAGDVFKEGQFLYVWVTDDPNRIPVYVESPIRVGTVRARIASWQGLKHQLTSKIE